jgi:four helix bundle protein
MRDYLIAWKLADDLTVALYERTRLFPKEELYGITSQLRRAAYSVAANIAEGASRETKRDYLHFLYIARGSLSEAHYFVHLSDRLRFLSAEEACRLTAQSNQVFGCLHGLIQSVEKESSKFSKLSATLTSLLSMAFIETIRP